MLKAFKDKKIKKITEDYLVIYDYFSTSDTQASFAQPEHLNTILILS